MIPTFLQEKIEEAPGQKLDYSQYMMAALYHPSEGYYMKPKNKVGTRGDFITSSNVHNVYGKLFAKLIVKYFNETDIPPVIIEVGGGNGRFAKHLLEEVMLLDAPLYDRLNYVMVETSPYHIKLQQTTIPHTAPVRYFTSLEEVPDQLREGVLFSNELFDALPVHVLEYTNGSLKEVFVTINEDGRLAEKNAPLFNEDILAYITKNKLSFSEGQRMEIPLAMMDFTKILGEWLLKGTIITVDYGYRFCELSSKDLLKGSLRGYYQHQLINDPLKYPTDMDLTSHIHLDALEECLNELDFAHAGTMRQGEFLVAAGILDYLQENQDPNPFSEKSKQNRAIRTLIMDSSWSNSFHVLIHEKGTNIWNKLIGLNPQ
ncbi:SAM-dependent methyltransferase [Sutcliffiella horikoshii]|uniref:SAM-dependent methyltransferase n=1 Tax=Sutcliffiella horikoshii TaxID=79883 RepID=A0A5D4T2P6_9BACI|nr:SAM-dependent methyltransferase [Sutcliffiella horikoshii]TYS68712.1 SAM-dependent methyltransferase [Sutcliffiella horikoshii]